MTTPKTRPTDASVDELINGLDDPQQQEDARALLDLMQRVTDAPAVLWGPSIIGFGRYHYTYASGREGDWMRTGFAPRKGKFSIYLMDGFSGRDALLGRLGKHSLAKSCLYIKRLDNIDLDVLETLVRASVERMREKYPDHS